MNKKKIRDKQAPNLLLGDLRTITRKRPSASLNPDINQGSSIRGDPIPIP